MKKDLLLLTTGIILGLTISYLSFSQPNTIIHSKKTTPLQITNNNSKIILKPNPLSKIAHSSEQNMNRIIQINIDSESNASTAKSSIDSLRTQLISKIQTLPDNEVKQIKNIVDKVTSLTPEKYFENEIRDPELAISLEDKLRYNFYEQNLLEGEGILDSLECRTRYCKARVFLPKDENMILINRFQNAFPGIALLSLNIDKQDDSNLVSSDIYIDLQSYETVAILENNENP